MAVAQHDRTHAETHAFCLAANRAQNTVRFRDVLLPPEALRALLGERLQAAEACRQTFELKTQAGLNRDDGLIVVVGGNLYDDESDEYFYFASRGDPELEATCPDVGILSLYHFEPESSFMRGGGKVFQRLSAEEGAALQSDTVVLMLLGLVGAMLTDLDTHEDLRGCAFDYCQVPSDALRGIRRGFVFCRDCERGLRQSPFGKEMLAIAATLKPSRTPQGPEQFLEEANVGRPIPATGENNCWYVDRSGDKVIVFVHGILSNSRSCWLREGPGPEHGRYWPELFARDTRFRDFSVFLAGYYTALDSQDYGVAHCADELFSALRRELAPGVRPVSQRQTIVFVCHSTGGVVVRYLLAEHADEFRGRQVGVVLIASPSYGSEDATHLNPLARLYGNQLGQELQWGSPLLRDLDRRFRRLLKEQRVPGLRGIEAYENHFILHRWWAPPRRVLVPGESAGRYFAPAVLLRDTDHFSAVKPDGPRHPAHELLVDFCMGLDDGDAAKPVSAPPPEK